MEIRRATVEDGVPVAAMVMLYMREEEFCLALTDDWQQKVAEEVGEALQREDVGVFVATEGKAYKGMALCAVLSGRTYHFPYGFLNVLYVHPDYRDKKVGLALLDAVMAWAQSMGAHGMVTHAVLGSTGEADRKRAGFDCQSMLMVKDFAIPAGGTLN